VQFSTDGRTVCFLPPSPNLLDAVTAGLRFRSNLSAAATLTGDDMTNVPSVRGRVLAFFNVSPEAAGPLRVIDLRFLFNAMPPVHQLQTVRDALCDVANVQLFSSAVDCSVKEAKDIAILCRAPAPPSRAPASFQAVGTVFVAATIATDADCWTMCVF